MKDDSSAYLPINSGEEPELVKESFRDESSSDEEEPAAEEETATLIDFTKLPSPPALYLRSNLRAR